MGDGYRARTDRRTALGDTDAKGPVRRVYQQAHHPQDPGPHSGREAGH
ncbi:hypothetical protein ACFV07_10565 [Streptomyces anulatus]